jgi:hypothetical protein
MPGACELGNKYPGSVREEEIPSLTEQPLASQEGPCSKDCGLSYDTVSITDCIKSKGWIMREFEMIFNEETML